jgi:hypothetical protein
LIVSKCVEYDVALSFAGEERAYVEQAASFLKDQGVKVFYDKYEEVGLWGKDLYEHLHDVYANKAKYCVIFISQAYASKVWPNLERRSAQERALRENREYILPARFDDTKLPGLPSTTGYIDLSGRSPEELARHIVEKLRGKPGGEPQRHRHSTVRTPRVQPLSFNPYDEAQVVIDTLKNELGRRSSALEEAGATLSVFDRADRTCFRVVIGARTVLSLDVWIGGMMRDSGLSFYATSGEVRTSDGAINAWGEIVWSKDEEQAVLEFHDLSLFNMAPGRIETLTTEEFIERTWNRIADEVERTTE